MGKVIMSGVVPQLVEPIALPAGYTKLKYIQSSGTQWINTDVKARFPLAAHMEIEFGSNYASVSGVLLGATTGSVHTVVVAASGSKWGIEADSGFIQSAKTYTGGTHYFVESNMGTSAQSFAVNGETLMSQNKSASGNDYTLYLFARNKTNTADQIVACKLYSCQIYSNGVLVRDFAPCIDNNGNVGLYDMVGKKFYGNAGTGVFVGSEVA